LTPRCDGTEEPGTCRTTFQSGNWESLTQADGAIVRERLKIARESIHASQAEPSWMVKIVTAFLDDPDSSTAAWFYSHFMVAFSVFAIMVGLLPYVGLEIPRNGEVAIDSILCAEILIRAMFCSSLSSFLENSANLVDSLSAVPLTVIFLIHYDLFDEEWGDAFLLSAVPVIRFLRFVRRFRQIQILITAFQDCLEALPVLLYTLAVMGCIFSSAIFLVEPRDNITTLSESAWLVISTISTVGYGDVTPSTKCGAALVSILMVVSQLYMAMPFGIIGYNFTIIWGRRTQILLLNMIRDRLAKQGFGAYEIPRLFELFDLDDSAEFDMEEFQLLFREMDMGFKEDDIVELFKTIDKDANGTIDEKEFVKTVYPNEYRYLYGKSRKGDRASRYPSELSAGLASPPVEGSIGVP